jgi:hypothetical protein
MTDTAMMCALAANVQQLQHFVVISAAPNEHCILLANVDFSASATKTIADQRDSRSGARAASILVWGGLFQQPNAAQPKRGFSWHEQQHQRLSKSDHCRGM